MAPASRTAAGPRRPKAERAAETRDLRVTATRGLFATRGYAGVNLDDVLDGLPVTKGALYYHFGDKRGLFRAVAADAQRELAAAVGGAESDPWRALEAACAAFSAVLRRSGLMRLVCAEAGQVLDHAEWNALDEAHGMGALRRFLDPVLESGLLPRLDPEAGRGS